MPDEVEFMVGIDEVGRGPIAGPVTIGACMCHRSYLSNLQADIPDITDSKLLSEANRERLAEKLHDHHRTTLALASVSAEVIDRIGISKALKTAITRVLRQLEIEPHRVMVLLDGKLHAPKRYQHQQTIIKGDQKEWLIGAASIVAKVRRDNRMKRYHKKYPKYRFHKHKGYGTPEHYLMLNEHGACHIHRMTFLPSRLRKRRKKK